MSFDFWQEADFPGVVWVRATAPITWEAYQQQVDWLVQYCRQSAQPVTVVFVPQTHLPPGNALAHMREAYRRLNREPRLQRLILVETEHSDAGRYPRVATVAAARAYLRAVAPPAPEDA
ncbi:MAG: hypothetical protein MUE40_21940 [Anaerolineae bacterium]|nr:hypothetical protein [Anaerolineae bacterium]